MLKPLLAATYEHAVTQLAFPVLGSPKLDGIRCLIQGGVALSRNLKAIRNEYIQSRIGRLALNGYDGELIVGAATGDLVYNRTNSGVMSRDGLPDFSYHVFDRWDLAGERYLRRLESLSEAVEYPEVKLVEQVLLEDQQSFNAYEITMLDAGYEGIMVRSLNGPYKMGRSTANEGILLKVKRFEDYEAIVLAIQEMESNTNPAIVDHLGHTIRSKHQSGMIPGGMLGAMLCARITKEGTPYGEPFRVAPGTMVHDQRRKYWNHPDLVIGKMIKVKSFAYGEVDQPRFARYHGHRDSIDQ